MQHVTSRVVGAVGGFFALGLIGCATPAGQFADQLNPYAEPGNVNYGERNTSALSESGGGGGKGAETARHALEVLGSYRRTQDPQPTYPVIQPAEVRLMWIPDRKNRWGDLVPAHYYYLRVLNDDWALQDAFEIEQRYTGGEGRRDYGATAGPREGTGATPWVYKDGK